MTEGNLSLRRANPFELRQTIKGRHSQALSIVESSFGTDQSMRDVSNNLVKYDTNLFGQSSESHRAPLEKTLILSAADYFNTPKAKGKQIDLRLTVESESPLNQNSIAAYFEETNVQNLKQR